MATTTSKKKTKKKSLPYDKEQYLEWYKLMYRIRRFERMALMMYTQNKIRGFCHVYIGQEAVAAGLDSAIRPEDPLITAYRQHGIALMRGLDSKSCMAELYGKETGCVKGKGGSMHFFSRDHNYFGGNGIVGAQIPIGTGMGFAEKYRDSDNVAVCMFGDGASRQGALHESFNMAMSWNLPVLYIIENNGYAMGTSVKRTSNVTELYTLGESYDMPSEQVNGMNVEDVHEAVTKAVKAIREGKGPHLLEMKTYRYKGHSVSDPAHYRTDEEVNSYKEKDPVKRVAKKMLEHGLLSEDELAEIKETINDEIQEAIDFAKESKYPDPSALYEDNYVQEDYPFIRD